MNEFVAAFVVGWAIGHYGPRGLRLAREAWLKWRMGICFRYEATGWLENRNGTVSDFCRRCGHPYGYHRFRGA